MMKLCRPAVEALVRRPQAVVVRQRRLVAVEEREGREDVGVLGRGQLEQFGDNASSRSSARPSIGGQASALVAVLYPL